MTISLSISSRYANVLFEISSQAKNNDAMLKELNALSSAVKASEVRKSLLSAGYPRVLKHKVWSKFTAKMKLSKLLQNFINVLIEHNRISLIEEIAYCFETLCLEASGFKRAEVVTSTALTDKEEKAMLKAAEEIFGHKLKIQQESDEKLLAGMIIQVGSRMFDASLLGKLKKLKLSMQNSK